MGRSQVLYNRTKGRYKNRGQQSSSSSGNNNNRSSRNPGRGGGASSSRRRHQPPPQPEIASAQQQHSHSTKRRPKYDESLLLLDTHPSRYYAASGSGNNRTGGADDDLVAISILSTAGGSTIDLPSLAATLETMPLSERLKMDKFMAKFLEEGSSSNLHISNEESQSSAVEENPPRQTKGRREASLRAALSLEEEGQSLASLNNTSPRNEDGLGLALASSNDTEADSIQSDLVLSPSALGENLSIERTLTQDQRMRMDQDNDGKASLPQKKQAIRKHDNDLPAEPSQHAGALLKSDSFSVANGNARVRVLPNGEVEVRDFTSNNDQDDEENDKTEDDSVRIDPRGNVEVRQKLITLALSETTTEEDDEDDGEEHPQQYNYNNTNPNLPDHLISPYRRGNQNHNNNMSILPNISEASSMSRERNQSNDPTGIRMSYTDASTAQPADDSSSALNDDLPSRNNSSTGGGGDRYRVAAASSTYTASSSSDADEPIEATLEKIEKVKQKLSIIDKSYSQTTRNDRKKKISSKVQVSAAETEYLEDWLDGEVVRDGAGVGDDVVYEDTQHAKIHADSNGSYDRYGSSSSEHSSSISTLTRTTAPTKSTHVVGTMNNKKNQNHRHHQRDNNNAESGRGGDGDDNLDDWLDTVIS